LVDSLELASERAKGLVIVTKKIVDKEEEYIFSRHFNCPECGISYEEISPRMFSFNSPYGACPACNGLGTRQTVDPELVVPDKEKSLQEGAIAPWEEGVGFYRWARTASRYYFRQFSALAKHYNFSLDTPFKDLSPRIQKVILYGSDPEEIEFTGRRGNEIYHYSTSFEGVVPNLERRYRESNSEYVREEIHKYVRETPCFQCGGARLRPESLAVTLRGRSIYDVVKMSIKKSQDFFQRIRLNAREKLIAEDIVKEVRKRLGFMVSVGLGYLTLDRRMGSLSGGEVERIRLATQIGSGLVGVIYILDEPTIGLHQRDIGRLLDTLKKLRDLGNTIIIVEHDRSTMEAADYIIDLGPGAGEHGGEIVAQGSLQDIISSPGSLTGKYLKGELKVPLPVCRRHPVDDHYLKIVEVSEHLCSLRYLQGEKV